MNIIEAKQKRAAAVERMQSLVATAKTEKRALQATERESFDAAEAEARDMSAHVERLESLRVLSNPTEARHGLVGADLRSGDASERGYFDWLGRELRDLSTGTSGAGALVPVDYLGVVQQALTAKSVGLASGFRVVRTNRHSLDIPKMTPGSASWVAEAGTMSDADPTVATVTATPKKLARFVVASSELVADGDPTVAQMVHDDITTSLALGLDLGFFEGTGSSNQPTGLVGVSGVNTVSMGTNGAIPTNLDPFLSAIGALAEDNAEASAIVMHPSVWTVLSKIKDSQDRYLLLDSIDAGKPVRAIAGVPVYLSSQLSVARTKGTASGVATNAYVYQADQVVAVEREALRFEASRDAKFATDQMAYRGICRWDIAVPNAEAVCVIDGILTA